MLDFLVHNIFVEFGGRIIQHTIGIPVGTSCAPLLADLFLYSYEAECVQELMKASKSYWPTGVRLLVFFFSTVPVVLFDTPEISRSSWKHLRVKLTSSNLHLYTCSKNEV